MVQSSTLGWPKHRTTRGVRVDYVRSSFGMDFRISNMTARPVQRGPAELLLRVGITQWFVNGSEEGLAPGGRIGISCDCPDRSHKHSWGYQVTSVVRVCGTGELWDREVRFNSSRFALQHTPNGKVWRSS